MRNDHTQKDNKAMDDVDDIDIAVLKSAQVLAFSYVSPMENLSLLTNVPSEDTPEVPQERAPQLCFTCARGAATSLENVSHTPSNVLNGKEQIKVELGTCDTIQAGTTKNDNIRIEDASQQTNQPSGGTEVFMPADTKGSLHAKDISNTHASAAVSSASNKHGLENGHHEKSMKDNDEDEEEEEEEQARTWNLLGFGVPGANMSDSDDEGEDDEEDNNWQRYEEYLCDDGVVKIGYGNLVVELLRPSEDEIGKL
jgi:hypothetical protein